MMIKATTTNPTTRFAPRLSLDVPHGQRDRLESWGPMPAPPRPLEADHGAGAEMISEKSRVQREHNGRLDGSANLLARDARSNPRISSHLRPIFTSCSREPKLPPVWPRQCHEPGQVCPG